MKFKTIIFDFDGTIADTSDGIIDSYKFTLACMGKQIPKETEFKNLIGGNLLNTFMIVFGFSKEEAKKAVSIYRKRYSEFGIHKACMYSGFVEMLKALKTSGIKVGIATLKAEHFAKEMLKGFGCLDLFDCVCGMDDNDNETKTSLIRKCVDLSETLDNDCLFVGDTFGDYEGALNNCISFLGVTYGFGFKNDCKYDFSVVNKPMDIISFLGI